MIRLLLGAVALFAAAATPAQAQPQQAPLSLWRLDCGSLYEPSLLPRWSDGRMPVSCYLVRHGSDYLLFDAGLSARVVGMKHPKMSLRRTISDQLRDIGVAPDQVKHVLISHYHGDHTSQATQFTKAKLVIGAGDMAALRRPIPPDGAAPSHLAPWLEGRQPTAELIEDLDVYGDGSVVALMTRGHTEGHLSLLVKLKSQPVILSGDLWASHGDVLTGEMPPFNTSFAETEASRDHVRRLALKHRALLVIGHEPMDVALLPAFPKAAE
jgi:glyoxylase-like metal-dependent hydrolase (beta-lactamase superfamily II)